MPKGSVRNPGTDETSVGRTWRRARNRGSMQSKRIDEAYASMNKRIDAKDARKANMKTMKKPGAGRVALTPIKKTIRPATSAKKGK
jgi:hypothetical protein